ncbi:MAG TPA: hypothetical protein DEQ69_09545 [Rhodobacteraceae bacterium]|nr:hypothetical protein [Paracoccaceae bacterium]
MASPSFSKPAAYKKLNLALASYSLHKTVSRLSLNRASGFRYRRLKPTFKTIEEVKSNLPIYNLGHG